MRSRDHILAQGLDVATIRRLERRGFVVARRTDAVVELQVPRGMSLAKSLASVSRVKADAIVATNDYYYPAGHAAPHNPGELEDIIAWPAAGPSCPTQPTIGLVDTALDTTSPFLVGRNIEVLTTSASSSNTGHGTAVAAILVGNVSAGVAGLLPEARLVAVDAFSTDPSGDRSDAMSLIQAIDVLVERNVDVINLSLAGPPNDLLKTAIDRAIDRGIPVVAAVGNDGPGAPPKYPAAYPSVVAVTATDRNMAVYRSANRGDYVDFAAPAISGTKVDHYGTSFAAPVVTAALAVVKQNQPDVSPAQAEVLLEKNAIDLGTPGRDGVYGWGLMQAGRICSLAPEGSEERATVSR